MLANIKKIARRAIGQKQKDLTLPPANTSEVEPADYSGGRAPQKILEQVQLAPGKMVRRFRRQMRVARRSCYYLIKCAENPARATAEKVGQSYERLLEAAISVGQLGGKTASDCLDYLSGDPDQEQHPITRGTRLAIGFLPVIGSAQNLGEARFTYRRALAADEPDLQVKLQQQARRECLAACASASVDVLALGTSRFLLKIANVLGISQDGVRTIMIGKRVGKIGWKVGGFERLTRAVDRTLDKALESPSLSHAMDTILKRLAAEEKTKTGTNTDTNTAMFTST